MIFKTLGVEGRTTIPFEIRAQMHLRDHDLISFTLSDDNQSVVIRKELGRTPIYQNNVVSKKSVRDTMKNYKSALLILIMQKSMNLLKRSLR